MRDPPPGGCQVAVDLIVGAQDVCRREDGSQGSTGLRRAEAGVLCAGSLLLVLQDGPREQRPPGRTPSPTLRGHALPLRPWEVTDCPLQEESPRKQASERRHLREDVKYK